MENKSLKYFEILFGLLFGLLFFPRGLKPIIIGLFAAFTIYMSFKRKITFKKKPFFVNAAFFLLMLITLLYSDDKSYGLKKIETMASLAVFPILFSMLTKVELKHVFSKTTCFLWVYITSVFLFNVLPFLWFYITNYTLAEILHHYPQVIIVDIGKYGIHPIYMSMHCALAIIFSIFQFNLSTKKISKVLLVFFGVTFLFFIAIYARKGPIISLVVTLLTCLFFYKKSNIKKYLTFTVITLLILFAAVPKVRERFSELIKIEKLTDKNENSTNIRYAIYKNSIELIKKAPVFGYGLGDYSNELSKSYALKNQTQLMGKKYNSHNQHLSFLLIGGCFLYLLFVAYNIFIIRNSVLKENYILLALTIFFLCVMFTENILEREYGVIFYAFFINYFSIKNIKE